MSKLSFSSLQQTNLERATRWHGGGIDDWSVNDWLVAFAGEAGEACNAGKKHRRLLSGFQQHGNVPTDLQDAEDKIMEELADTVIYADLTASRLKRSLSHAIVKKFNAISDREGFPERLDEQSFIRFGGGELVVPDNGMAIIEAERSRHAIEEGYDAAHDDSHIAGQLADGAACYACASGAMTRGARPEELAPLYVGFDAAPVWPWPGDGEEDETPKLDANPIRNLAKAGSMIAAEIDRLLRLGCPNPFATPPATDVRELLWNAAAITGRRKAEKSGINDIPF